MLKKSNFAIRSDSDVEKTAGGKSNFNGFI